MSVKVIDKCRCGNFMAFKVFYELVCLACGKVIPASYEEMKSLCHTRLVEYKGGQDGSK